VSVRLVQYYFGTKGDLIRAANEAVGERMGARVLKRIRATGIDAPPRDLVAGVAKEFLPTTKPSREAMLLFYAFYTAQLTDASLQGAVTRGVPQGLVTFVANQIRRAQEDGDAPAALDADCEATIFVAALPGIASGVLVGFLTAAQARRTLDYAVARIFGAPR
jgi:AcrR family transcriptional regulator